jgi:hypothetical protein
MPTPNSTFASRRRERLAHEAVEGVPPRRQLGLQAGDQAEALFTIETVDEGSGVSAT